LHNIRYISLSRPGSQHLNTPNSNSDLKSLYQQTFCQKKKKKIWNLAEFEKIYTGRAISYFVSVLL
jgi:hypothetical protein